MKHPSTMRLISTTLLLLVLIVSHQAAAAKPATPPGAAGYYTDATGVQIPCGIDAQRIVSLAPNVTEMVYAIGLGHRLVGRTDFCNYPPAVLDLPTVGGFVDTSLEQIIVLRPDLVLAYQGNSLELVQQLRQAGLTVLAFNEPVAIPEIVEQMELLWRVAATLGADAPPVIPRLRDDLSRIAKSVRPGKVADRPVVYFGYPGENSLTTGQGSFLDDLITRAGGHNAAGEVAGRWPVVSAEFLVAADPDWILTATPCAGEDEPAAAKVALLAELKRDTVWRNLAAVKQGNVLVFDADVLLRPGPRIVEALAQLALALNPARTGVAGG